VRITDHASSGPQTVSLMGRGMHDVILTWDASISSGVVGYKVYRRTTSRRESSKALNSIPIKDNTFVDANDVVAGDTYYCTKPLRGNSKRTFRGGQGNLQNLQPNLAIIPS
jgi:hypothetical protein